MSRYRAFITGVAVATATLCLGAAISRAADDAYLAEAKAYIAKVTAPGAVTLAI